MEFVTTRHPDQTLAVGERLGSALQPGDIVALDGDLGAGKTLLTKGIARSLGISDSDVTSPTFSLIHEYAAPVPLYHFDLYRLEDPEELWNLGYEDYFFGQGICVIEWAERITAYLPAEYLAVIMQKTGDTERVMEFVPFGKRYAAVVQAVKEALPCW